jgi:tetratricopeptide (TPR) repeat protein
VPGDLIFRQAQAGTNNNLAAVYMDTSRFREAEDFFRRTEAVYGKLSDEFPLVPDYRLSTLTARANTAAALSRQGRNQESAALLGEVQADLETLTRKFSGEIEYAEILADAFNNLGMVLNSLDRKAEGRSLLEKAIALNQAMLDKHPGRVQSMRALANNSFNLGLLLFSLEQFDDSFGAFAAAVWQVENLPETVSRSVEPASTAAAALTEQAGILREVRQHPGEALTLLDRADDFLDRGLRSSPRMENVRIARAAALRQRGEALLDLGRRKEAEPVFREVITVTRGLVADFSWSDGHRNRLGDDLCLLVRVWEGSADKNGESTALVREAVELQEKILSGQPAREMKDRANRSLAKHLEWLAILLMESGQREAAVEAHRRSEELRRRFVAEHPESREGWCDLGAGLNNFAIRLRDAGDPAASLVLLQQAVEAQQKALQISPSWRRARWFLRIHFMNLARAQRKLEDRAAAMESWRAAVRTGDELVREFPQVRQHRNELAMDLRALSDMELDTGLVAEALRNRERVVSLVAELVGESGPPLPNRQSLADLQQSLSRLYALGPEAELRDAARAVTLAKAAVENHPHSPTAWHALGLAHCMAKAPQEAIAATEKSMELTGAGDALNWFVRAMIRHQLGDTGGAGRDFARALEWLRHDGSTSYRQIAVPYQEEAAKLLAVEADPAPGGTQSDAASREQ